MDIPNKHIIVISICVLVLIICICKFCKNTNKNEITVDGIYSANYDWKEKIQVNLGTLFLGDEQGYLLLITKAKIAILYLFRYKITNFTKHVDKDNNDIYYKGNIKFVDIEEIDPDFIENFPHNQVIVFYPKYQKILLYDNDLCTYNGYLNGYMLDDINIIPKEYRVENIEADVFKTAINNDESPKSISDNLD